MDYVTGNCICAGVKIPNWSNAPSWCEVPVQILPLLKVPYMGAYVGNIKIHTKISHFESFLLGSYFQSPISFLNSPPPSFLSSPTLLCSLI